MADPDAGSIFTSQMLEQAADPSLPEGVIAVQDSGGRWWRYPLCEFMEADHD
jgi:hypothetical protein